MNIRTLHARREPPAIDTLIIDDDLFKGASLVDDTLTQEDRIWVFERLDALVRAFGGDGWERIELERAGSESDDDLVLRVIESNSATGEAPESLSGSMRELGALAALAPPARALADAALADVIDATYALLLIA